MNMEDFNKIWKLMGHAKQVYNGSEKISDDMRDKRLEICRGCEYMAGENCKLCGCFLFEKTKWSHESCPLNKWDV